MLCYNSTALSCVSAMRRISQEQSHCNTRSSSQQYLHKLLVGMLPLLATSGAVLSLLSAMPQNKQRRNHSTAPLVVTSITHHTYNVAMFMLPLLQQYCTDHASLLMPQNKSETQSHYAPHAPAHTP